MRARSGIKLRQRYACRSLSAGGSQLSRLSLTGSLAKKKTFRQKMQKTLAIPTVIQYNNTATEKNIAKKRQIR